jgi:hypothetical protein
MCIASTGLPNGFIPEGINMRGVISVFAGLLATSGMAWAEPCRVAQTGALNVHGEPNGPIVGTLNEGTIVSMSSVITVRRHRWAKIVPLQGRTGWVLRNFLLCEWSAPLGMDR